jgi:hypothetical protein
MYTLERGWIDTAGKTRTWKILAPDGQKVAEVTTKRDALRLIALLTR